MQIEIATIPIRQMGIILSKVKCCLYFLVYQLLAKLNYFLKTWLFPVRYALSSRMNCYYHPIHFLFNPFSCRLAFLCSLLLSNNEIFDDELRNEKNESCLVMMFRRAILFIHNDDMESTIYKKRLVFTSSNSFRIL